MVMQEGRSRLWNTPKVLTKRMMISNGLPVSTGAAYGTSVQMYIFGWISLKGAEALSEEPQFSVLGAR